MPKLSSTDSGSSGEIQLQGDVVFVSAPLLPIHDLSPIISCAEAPDFPPPCHLG